MRNTRPLIDRHARRMAHYTDARLKARAEPGEPDLGYLEGYASTWGNVDGQNEVMTKGAFARSIQQSVPAGRVKLMAKHYAYGGDTLECIGTIVEAREDQYGLFIRAEFASTAQAQEVRKLVTEGHVKGLSVGFRPIRWEFQKVGDKEVLHYLECMLLETTITCRPVNELAKIIEAKSAPSQPIPSGGAGATPSPNTAPGQPGAPDPSPPAPISAKAAVTPVLRGQLELVRLKMESVQSERQST